MRSIISWSLQARVFIVAIAAGLMLLGTTQAHNASVDRLPEFEPVMVEVQTEALGLSATEVEQLITVPLEADLLAGVAWLDEIRSESVPSLSRIELQFLPGTDEMQARQMVQERMTQAHALPNVSKAPEMLQPKSSTSRVMMIALTSDELSLIDLSVLARWTLKPRLLGVNGVSDVSIFGQRERQLQVQVDPERMAEHDVTLDQVVATTGNALWVSPLTFLEASSPGTGGFIETPNQRLGVQHVQPLSSPEELAQLPIEDRPIIKLSDVATLAEDHQPLIGNAVLNGQGLLLVVEKFPDTNALEVTNELEDTLESLRPGLVGVQLDSTIYRPATGIEDGLSDLTVAALASLVLALLIFAAFFFGWRAALITGIVVPASLMGAAIVLYATGTVFNVIVLAGLIIALAVIVDEAVIDVDNVLRRLRARRAEGADQPVSATILAAVLEMRGAVVFGSVIALLATLPLFFLDGPSGEFFPPLVGAYALAIVVAMVVSLTLTPALALFLLGGAKSDRESPVAEGVQKGYRSVLTQMIRTPGLPLLAFALIALGGIAAATQLDQNSLLPTFKERDVLINWDGPAGTSEPEMTRIIGAAGEEIRQIPGVRNVGAHVGRAISSDQVVGANAGELWVSIDPKADYDKTIDSIQEVVDGYPGLSRNLVTYSEERVSHVLNRGANDIVVRVYGEQQEVLNEKAEELRAIAAGIDGVGSARTELPVVEPAIEVEVDLAAAQNYGIKPGDVRRAAAVMLSGIEVGSLFEQQKVFEVVVWSTKETRSDLAAVQNLTIDTPRGAIRLDDVADVRIAPNPNVIRREAVSRYVDVGITVDGRGADAVTRDLEKAVREVGFPLDHHAEVFGPDIGRETVANTGLPIAIAVAIIAFLIIQMALASWRLAAVFFVTVPVALAGGAVAAFADGGDLTIGAYAGFLALLALAARNCISLVKHYQTLQSEGVDLGPALIVRGAGERVAPIVMTALTVAVALLPPLFLGEIFAYEVVRPMAVVVLGGLVTTTLYNLFIVPALYARFAPEVEIEAARSPLSASQGEVPA